MMTSLLEQIWLDLYSDSSGEVFKLVDETHPLNIYAGINHLNQHIILLVSSCEPSTLPLSESIHVTVAKRQDGRWALKMILTDPELGQMFSILCNDLVLYTHHTDSESSLLVKFRNRYIKWMYLLERKGTVLLDNRTLQGLIGELILLKHLISLYGPDIAVQAWVGPLAVHQDFHFGNRWYEAKSVHTGAEHVKISSIEQLDVPDYPGELVIVEVDKATGKEPASFSISDLIEEMRSILIGPVARLDFEDKLLELGYTDREEYGESYFVSGRIRFFEVISGFPNLQRSDLPYGIISASYELSIASIKNFEITERMETCGYLGLS